MSLITPNSLKYGILSFVWLEYGWDSYLNMRQYSKIYETQRTPTEIAHVMTASSFESARRYALTRMEFRCMKTLVSTVITTIIIYTDLMAHVWIFSEKWTPIKQEVIQTSIWLLMLSIIFNALDLLFSTYEAFTIEQEFGFNRQSPEEFMRNHKIMFIVTQVMLSFISAVIILFVQWGGPYFFIYLWLYIFTITIAMAAIYPSVIAPKLERYSPLPDGELRAKINNLASELNFPLTDIYVVEASTKSSHSNAYFYGFFSAKRIVLYDTIFQTQDGTGCDNDQIVAILAHELGHWYHNHIIISFVVVEANLFIWLSVFAYFLKKPILFQALGFKKARPIIVGFIAATQYLLMPYNILVEFLQISLSRKAEFEADAYAAKLGRGGALQVALISLYRDNLTFPVVDSLYSKWRHTHPSLLERLAALDKLT